jgi:tetratricopeptide (TPR) repeat protein
LNSPLPDPVGFWTDLRRRRVFRALAIYAGAAFVVLQGADLVLRPLGISDKWYRALVIIALAGVPVAAIVSWLFDITPDGIRRTRSADTVAHPASRAWTAAAVLLLAVLAFGGWRAFRRFGPHEAIDANVVAVLPFRVSGAEKSLGYLREGVVDLLATKLTGAGGPRAADPRRVLSEVRERGSAADELPEEDARSVARALGAGQVVLGSVVGNPQRVVLSATLYETMRRRTLAQATVTGPADNIAALVDILAAKLLSLSAGEGENRLEELTTRSLPALQHYLAGRQVYRSGNYTEATKQFSAALQLDSTFALAALEVLHSIGWTGSAQSYPALNALARRRAWAERDKLSERDRWDLISLVGPRYPEPSGPKDVMAAREKLVTLSPDDAEAWYAYGDIYLHSGRSVEFADWETRALKAFQRAIELDSSFAGPYDHLVPLAARARDRGNLRRWSDAYLRRYPTGETADYIRWNVAAALNDTVTLDQIHRNIDALPPTSTILWIVAVARQDGLDIPGAVLAVRSRVKRADTDEERRFALGEARGFALDRGRPEEAASYASRLRTVLSPEEVDQRDVLAALYWDGDRGAGQRAAAALEHAVAQPSDSAHRATGVFSRCVLEQWRIANGNVANVRPTVAALTNLPRDANATTRVRARVCAATLDLMDATRRKAPDAVVKAARLDSMTQALTIGSDMRCLALLNLVRAHRDIGNLRAALTVSRRRNYFAPVEGSQCIAPLVREQAALAAQLGERDEAIRAYQHYLALRFDPEPQLAGEVAQARAALARLLPDKTK